MTRPSDGLLSGGVRGVWALVRDPPPPEFEALLERRRRLGLDVLDEVWDGVYVMRQVPAPWHADLGQQLAVILGPLAREAGLVPLSSFNLGTANDYRVPDAGLSTGSGLDRLYVPTVELVVEIVAPGDGTWDKLAFYATHDVRELLIVEAQGHEIHWLGLRSGRDYEPVARSALVALGPADLAERIDWPL